MQAFTIQDISRWPSTKDFIAYVEQNLIPNCPISKADIMRAEDILWANVGALKGKTTWKRSASSITKLIYQKAYWKDMAILHSRQTSCTLMG